MCTTKSKSQVGVERRRVLRLGIKGVEGKKEDGEIGGEEDRSKGVEGKAGEERNGEELWSSYHPREEWGEEKKLKEETSYRMEKPAHGVSHL